MLTWVPRALVIIVRWHTYEGIDFLISVLQILFNITGLKRRVFVFIVFAAGLFVCFARSTFEWPLVHTMEPLSKGLKNNAR